MEVKKIRNFGLTFEKEFSMHFPDGKSFKLNKRYSGMILFRCRNSFDFQFHSCFSTSFFERTGSVVFSDFYGKSFAFGQ